MTRNVKIAFITLLIAAPSPSIADIELDYAEPRVGHIVPLAPKKLVLHFTEESEPEGTSIEVTGEDGVRYDKGLVESEDKSVGVVKLKPLPPGVYSVRWHARSDDSATQGRYRFQVLPVTKNQTLPYK